MTEPTYHYVRGQGWVPGYYKTHVEKVGQFIVTVIDRIPELGEIFFTHSDADDIMTEIHDSWWMRRLNNRNWNPFNEFAAMDDSGYCRQQVLNSIEDKSKIVTMIFELVPDGQ